MNSQLLRLYAVAARNLLLGGNLRSLLLLDKPREMVAYATENLFAFQSIADQRGIPQRNVFEVFPQAHLAKINLCNNGETWFRRSASYVTDIVSLCLICQAVKPKVIFEIGTLTGYTTAHMALNCDDDCSIYSLDLPPDSKLALATTAIDRFHVKEHHDVKRYVWEGMGIAKRIQPLFGDSATFDYSPYHGRIDLFFIDGSHSYEYVRSDTLNALKCCRPGGVIAWHDFGRVGVNGVSRWLLEFSKQHRVYSVPGGSIAFCVISPT